MLTTLDARHAHLRPLHALAHATAARVSATAGIGVFAGALSLVGAGTPSYWGDEAASVLAAARPLPVLFGMLGHIDAVHGVYYVFLHYWIALVGSSEAAVRLPSSVAVGVAAAGPSFSRVACSARRAGSSRGCSSR